MCGYAATSLVPTPRAPPGERVGSGDETMLPQPEQSECAPSSTSYLHVSLFITRNPNEVSLRRRLNRVKAHSRGRLGQGQRVSRRHGRVSPEERGRNLGRSVTAIYRLCSVARQVVLSTSNLLGPMSLARWVMA